jgi:hypothetical protein
MVLLRHTLPDGAWHYDWLVRWRAGDVRDAARPLLAVRVMAPPDGLDVGASMAGEVIRDHREIYLDFEGELAPAIGPDGLPIARGVVERIARGSGEAWRVAGETGGNAGSERGLIEIRGRFEGSQEMLWTVDAAGRVDRRG